MLEIGEDGALNETKSIRLYSSLIESIGKYKFVWTVVILFFARWKGANCPVLWSNHTDEDVHNHDEQLLQLDQGQWWSVVGYQTKANMDHADVSLLSIPRIFALGRKSIDAGV